MTGNLFNDDPFAQSTTADLLVAAGQQLRDADKLMTRLESQQKQTIDLLHQLVDLVEKLEIERNAWRFKAEEMERERNIWQSRHDALEVQYRKAARRAAELGALTGESRCPECGSAELTLRRGGYSVPEITGDRWVESALTCQECGHYEEVKPS